MNDLISRLSELRCQYNCFDENERDAYYTLSEAIKALSDVPDTNVGDPISRQAAIYTICIECHDGACDEYPCGEIKALEKLPSVQPEQKSGTWIHDGVKRICPFCKDFIVTGRSIVKYCWNCGARLKERSEE